MLGNRRDRVFSRRGRVSVWHWPRRVGLFFLVVAGASLAAGTFAPQSEDAPDRVSRADTDLIVLPSPIRGIRAEPASALLRAPLRITDKKAHAHDLGRLIAQGLAQFGYEVDAGDKLHSLLLQVLAEGQSDAYVDAAVNAALARGDFAGPKQLITPSGALDTDRLLDIIVRLASS